ncbi:N-acetylneuraminate lyase-like [Leptidea sinapis]|uniref:N-acetylneuraminate lyase-like n=1 Tax=Leptidea sinapis TaxID=189913 RepID=UPI00212B2E3F|nr:N-acetylneuraminate lyase-like [Leptidea sinapis]
MYAIFEIQGLVAPVFTPITDTGAVNLDVIQKYAQYLTINRITTVLVGGTTGEFASLNVQERNEVLDAWLEAAKPLRMKVIAQVGGASLPDVLRMAEHAENAKADAIMTLPELYFKPKTTEHVVSYLDVVSRAAPSLPLLYYHFPMRTGVNVNAAEFFTTAAKRIPNFMGMKADLQVAVQVGSHLTDGRKVFIANHLLGPSALLGHDSSIATVNNMFPTLSKDIVVSTKIGDVTKARTLQEKLNLLVDGIMSNGDFVPSMKVAMEVITGVKVGPPRFPQKPCDELMQARIEEHLRTFGY